MLADTPRLLFVVILILLNGFFVASEFALVAIRKTRIDELAKKGKKAAQKAQAALNELDTYISSTQLGITLASLALGWVGEPAISVFLSPALNAIPLHFLNPRTESAILAFIIMTFLQIVIGELVPKNISLQRAESTLLKVITPLQLFTTVFKPFISILNKSGELVLKAVGMHSAHSSESTLSEEEVKMVIANSAQKGILEKGEVDMVYKVLQFTDMPIQQIMVPRTDVVEFYTSEKISTLLQKIKKISHSRYPIYEKTIDNIIGFVHIKDLYNLIDTPKEKKSLKDFSIIRKIIYSIEARPADEVLYEMRKKRIHIGVVMDEYGGTAGIVTLEDIVETIIGDIKDEFEQPGKDIEKQQDGSYIVNGLTAVARVQQKMKLPLKGQGYTTVGGLIYGLLGKAPQKGDKVQIGNVSMEVLDLHGKRINTLRVKNLT
jgi:CBS domain containing-hemolysin-like protein